VSGAKIGLKIKKKCSFVSGAHASLYGERPMGMGGEGNVKVSKS
jgi:hypothetical protein